MRLLCTNDDGILAQGLETLARAAEPLGEVFVVAPDREQSATSHSLTLHHPVRPVQRGDRRWQVDGTPTDCVLLAVEALLPERPDFVLSGVNHGQNLGEDVLYSGTVAAAMEGIMLGIPSVAFSFAYSHEGGADRVSIADHAESLTSLLRHLLTLPGLSRTTLLNVNVPAIAPDEVKGVRLTRLGRRVYSGSLTPLTDPYGRKFYWIGGGSAEWSGEPDSDFQAVREGYISVTPLHLDLTHHDMLTASESWWRAP